MYTTLDKKSNNITVPERLRNIQIALRGSSCLDEKAISLQYCDFDQWHNGPGWPGDFSDGVREPDFDQGPR